jgi:hypothetical protein
MFCSLKIVAINELDLILTSSLFVQSQKSYNIGSRTTLTLTTLSIITLGKTMLSIKALSSRVES